MFGTKWDIIKRRRFYIIKQGEQLKLQKQGKPFSEDVINAVSRILATYPKPRVSISAVTQNDMQDGFRATKKTA